MGINSYAIDLELNLKNNMSADLQTISDTISNMQAIFTEMADMNIQPIKLMAFEDISKVVANTSVSMGNINDAIKEITDSNKTGTELNDLINKQVDKLEEKEKTVLKHILEIEKHLHEFFQIKYPKINDLAKILSELSEKTAGSTRDIAQNVSDAANNAGHTNTEMAQQASLMGNLVNGSNSILVSLVSSVGKLKLIDAAWRQIWGYIKAALEDYEKFIVANFRMYGSVSDVAAAVRHITMETRLLRAEATAAYIALANLGTSKDQIDQLTASVGMAARVMGQSAEIIATYTARTRILGMSVDQTNKQFANAAAAMSKYGMGAKEMNTVIQSVTQNTAKYAAWYGDEQAKKMLTLTSNMTGFGHSVGLAADQMTKLIEEMLSLDPDSVGMNFQAYTGALFETDPTKKIQMQMEGMADLYNELEAARASNDSAEIMRVTSLIKSLDKTVDQVMTIGKEASKMKPADMTAQSLASLEEQFDATLHPMRAVQEITDKLSTMFGHLARAIGPLIKAVADITIWFVQLFNYVFEAISSIGKFTSAIENLSKWFTDLGTSISKLTAADIGKWIWSTIINLGKMAAVIYIGIKLWGLFFWAIGSGASAATAPTQTFMQALNVGKLLALAVVIASVGFVLMQLVEVLKQVAVGGGNAVAALVVLGLTVVGMIVAIGMAGSLTWPVLLAVGAAFLMLGAAVWLVGQAIATVLGALNTMVDSLSELGKTGWGLLQASIGLTALAFAVVAFAASAGNPVTVAFLWMAIWPLSSLFNLLIEGAPQAVAAAGALSNISREINKLADMPMTKLWAAVKNLKSIIKELPFIAMSYMSGMWVFSVVLDALTSKIMAQTKLTFWTFGQELKWAWTALAELTDKTIKSNQTSTIKVLREDTVAQKTADQEAMSYRKKTAESLESINKAMSNLDIGKNNEVKEIKDLLKEYLPGIVSQKKSIGSDFNGWMR